MPASSLLKMSITEYSWSLLWELRSTVLITAGNVMFDVEMLLPTGHKTFWIIMLCLTWGKSVFGKGTLDFLNFTTDRLHYRNTVVLTNLSIIICSWWHSEGSSQLELLEWYHEETLYPFIWLTSYPGMLVRGQRNKLIVIDVGTMRSTHYSHDLAFI